MTRVHYRYPQNISEIGYASFMHIKKYTYSKALSHIANGQDDILGALGGFDGGPSGSARIREYMDKLARTMGAESATGRTDLTYIDNTVKTGDTVDHSMQTVIGKAGKQKISGAEFDRVAQNTFGGDNRDEEKWDERNIAAAQAAERRRQEFNKRRAGLFGEYAELALPQEMQYEYGANWNNVFKLGVLSMIGDDPAMGTRITALTGSGAIGLSVINNFIGNRSRALDDQKPLTTGAGSSAQKIGKNLITDPFGATGIPGTQLNAQNLMGLAGLAPNENAIQMFKNMDFRNFDLTFQFAARNSKESTEIEELIEWFKLGMHPGKYDGMGTATILDFPDLFELHPKFVPVNKTTGEVQSPIRHPMMPRTKLCGLTKLAVNLTPMGQLQTVFDGSFPIVTCSLRFTELTALTKADFGNMKKGSGRDRNNHEKTQAKDFAALKADDFYSY